MSLPRNWHTMSLDTLWTELNDPRYRPTPQSTIEAIMFAVRERGLEALNEPETLERLRWCDEAAHKQINERIEKLLAVPTT